MVYSFNNYVTTMKKYPDIYKNAIKKNFQFLKNALSARDAFIRSIDIPKFGSLVPLCAALAENEDILEKLTNWRNENVEAYPSQFVASIDSTRNWFKKNLIENDGRILFLIVTSHGEPVGHIGFNSCINDIGNFEIDNVIRGVKGAPKGIMSASMKALIEWARRIIPVETFNLRVMEHNHHAIKFYIHNGFIEKSIIPLKKIVKDSLISYVEINDGSHPDQSFIEMIYSPSSNSGNQLILTAGPSISQKEVAYAFDAAENGWNSQWNKYITNFEEKFKEFVDAKYAISTSSCTGALQIALMSLEIGQGDEVIVPDQTWVASAKAIDYVGATPIFADIELDNWNIDSTSIEKLITKKTKAIVVVHMYGAPARMTPIIKLAKKYNLKIVEDAAPAIGATWKGRAVGTFGDFGAYSFQGAKLLVTGEGGMLVTNKKTLYEKAKKIADQGRNPLKTFWIDGKGVKFKISNAQAAIGLAQIERADELIYMKRRIFSWYEQRLAMFPGLHLNKEVENARSIYWMTSLRLDKTLKLNRDELIKALRKRNIDSRPVFPAISQYPIWTVNQNPQPVALEVGNTSINLPSGVCLSRDDVMYVCDQIIDILELK